MISPNEEREPTTESRSTFFKWRNRLTALAAAAVNASRARQGKAAIYYDSWLPFMAYTTQTNADGGTDLIVANMVDRLLGLAGLTDSNGFMVVKNYHMVKSSAGGNNFASGFKALGITPGDLGMVFRDFNPVAFLAAVNDNSAWPERAFCMRAGRAA